MRLLFTALALLLPFSAPAAAPSGTAAIRQVLSAQETAWNRGDVADFMDGYWRSPQTQFIGVGGVTLGWATVRGHYLKTFPNRAAMGRLSYSGVQITQLCPDAAYVVGQYRLDRAHDHPHGVFTLLFRRVGDDWRIVSDHTTTTGS